MPPRPAQPGATSQMLAASIAAFRTLITTIQGIGEPGSQMNRVVNSMGDIATVFEQFASAAEMNERQHEAVAQHINQQLGINGQMQQQLNQQATINNQMNDLIAQTRTQQQTAGQAPSRRSLCETRSASNLKILGSKKEDFKNWNEKLINATTQVFLKQQVF